MTDHTNANGSATASAAAVAGLAREVEALRKVVRAAGELHTRVDELARLVAALGEQVATLHGPRARPAAPSWLDLPAQLETTRRVLADLTGWLETVYLRYPDASASFPECWAWHPEVIEEILWCRQAWQAAYRDESANAAAAGDWHDRQRPGVVRRIKTYAGTCSLEAHQPHDGRLHAHAPVPLAEALEPIAAWWTTHRDQPAPEPTDEQLAAARDAQRRTRR
jgi:HPt (histidine-containing phosphotransfer) domain-containing protein